MKKQIPQSLLYLTLFLFGILLIFDVAAEEAGYSNPDGYMVNVYFEYAGCQGGVTAKIATALGVCINSGMMGTPYINQSTIYTLDSNGINITATTYKDSACTLSAGTSVLGGCAVAGNAISTSYSATLPSLVVDDPILEQIQYDYNSTDDTYAMDGNDDDNECISGDYVTLYYAVFSNTCQFDCGEGGWSCQFVSCRNGTANVTFSESDMDDADDNGACSASVVDTTLLTTTCFQKIACLDTNGDDEIISSNSDSKDQLGSVVVASISIAVASAIIALCVAIFWYQFRRPSSTSETEDNKSTLHTAFNP